MRAKRKFVGLVASGLLHAGLLAWSIEPAPRDDPGPPPVEVELIEIADPTPGRLAAAADAERPAPVAATTRSAPEPSAPPTRHVRSRAPRAEPTPPAAAPEPEEPVAEPAAEPAAAEPSPPEPAVPASARASANAGGVGGSGRGAVGRTDHSAYGAEIVRLVLAELDARPVPGIAPSDSIQLLIEVLPDGELAWTHSGRFGFAQVLATSLGRVRTRQILRRVEAASRHFPSHPDGFARRRFVVDVTVNFRDLAA